MSMTINASASSPHGRGNLDCDTPWKWQLILIDRDTGNFMKLC